MGRIMKIHIIQHHVSGNIESAWFDIYAAEDHYETLPGSNWDIVTLYTGDDPCTKQDSSQSLQRSS